MPMHLTDIEQIQSHHEKRKQGNSKDVVLWATRKILYFTEEKQYISILMFGYLDFQLQNKS